MWVWGVGSGSVGVGINASKQPTLCPDPALREERILSGFLVVCVYYTCVISGYC